MTSIISAISQTFSSIVQGTQEIFQNGVLGAPKQIINKIEGAYDSLTGRVPMSTAQKTILLGTGAAVAALPLSLAASTTAGASVVRTVGGATLNLIKSHPLVSTGVVAASPFIATVAATSNDLPAFVASIPYKEVKAATDLTKIANEPSVSGAIDFVKAHPYIDLAAAISSLIILGFSVSTITNIWNTYALKKNTEATLTSTNSSGDPPPTIVKGSNNNPNVGQPVVINQYFDNPNTGSASVPASTPPSTPPVVAPSTKVAPGGVKSKSKKKKTVKKKTRRSKKKSKSIKRRKTKK
jgi:hypothetical protein